MFTPVATLPSAWRYRVSTGTGLCSVSILWLDEVESLICNFSVLQHVKLFEQICPWDTLACCWDIKQPTHISHSTNKVTGLPWQHLFWGKVKHEIFRALPIKRGQTPPKQGAIYDVVKYTICPNNQMYQAKHNSDTHTDAWRTISLPKCVCCLSSPKKKIQQFKTFHVVTILHCNEFMKLGILTHKHDHINRSQQFYSHHKSLTQDHCNIKQSNSDFFSQLSSAQEKSHYPWWSRLSTAPWSSMWSVPKYRTNIQVKTLLVGCLRSQQHARVCQGRICSDNCTCCHTEMEVADQTFHLTQAEYTDTRPTSPSVDPIMRGAWLGGPLECQCWSHRYDSTQKKPSASGNRILGLLLLRQMP